MYSQTATTRKSCKNYDQIGCLSILNSFNPSFSHSNQFKVASKSQIKLEKSNQCRLWEKFLQNSIYRTVSIKRPYLIFFQKSLLNVPYDRKKEGLNILSYRSYNRVVRVMTFDFRIGRGVQNDQKNRTFYSPLIFKIQSKKTSKRHQFLMTFPCVFMFLTKKTPTFDDFSMCF